MRLANFVMSKDAVGAGTGGRSSSAEIESELLLETLLAH